MEEVWYCSPITLKRFDRFRRFKLHFKKDCLTRIFFEKHVLIQNGDSSMADEVFMEGFSSKLVFRFLIMAEC